MPITAVLTTPGAQVSVGTVITSTLVVTNANPLPVVGVAVACLVPPTPAGTVRVWTATTSGTVTGSSLSGTGPIVETLDLDALASITYTIRDTVVSPGLYTLTAFAENTTTNGLTVTVCALPLAAGVEGSAALVKLCSISTVTAGFCADGVRQALLVGVVDADGALIPASSVEFPAPSTGYGIFSAIGYFRSYFTDLFGLPLAPQPTLVAFGTCGGGGGGG